VAAWPRQGGYAPAAPVGTVSSCLRWLAGRGSRTGRWRYWGIRRAASTIHGSVSTGRQVARRRNWRYQSASYRCWRSPMRSRCSGGHVRSLCGWSSGIAQRRLQRTGSSPPEQLITFGPGGYEAYARLRFIPDPSWRGQLEAEARVPDDTRLISPRHGALFATLRVLLPARGPVLLLRMGRLLRELLPGRPAPRPAGLNSASVGPPLCLVQRSARWQDEFGQGSPPPASVCPADHRWCFASDVDPDWAGIGGEQAAIDRLVDDPQTRRSPGSAERHAAGVLLIGLWADISVLGDETVPTDPRFVLRAAAGRVWRWVARGAEEATLERALAGATVDELLEPTMVDVTPLLTGRANGAFGGAAARPAVGSWIAPGLGTIHGTRLVIAVEVCRPWSVAPVRQFVYWWPGSRRTRYGGRGAEPGRGRDSQQGDRAAGSQYVAARRSGGVEGRSGRSTAPPLDHRRGGDRG